MIQFCLSLQTVLILVLWPLVQVIRDIFFLTLPYFTCTKGFPSLGSHSAKWHFCPVVQLLISCSCVVIMIQASVGGQVYRVYTVWEFQLVSPDTLPAAPSCRLPVPSCSQLPLASELPDNNSPSHRLQPLAGEHQHLRNQRCLTTLTKRWRK